MVNFSDFYELDSIFSGSSPFEKLRMEKIKGEHLYVYEEVRSFKAMGQGRAITSLTGRTKIIFNVIC